MTSELYQRLQASRGLDKPGAQPVAMMTALWRRGHLRAPDLRDRRRDIRIPTNDQAELTPTDGAPLEIRVLDVSRGGMRIASSFHLAAGSLVKIHLSGTDVIAEVRHCARVSGCYHTGLQVRHVV